MLHDAFDGDAHALLMLVYKDPQQPMELRLEVAGKAIRYEKPALAAVDVTNHDVKFVISGDPVDRDGIEWAAKFCGEPTEH